MNKTWVALWAFAHIAAMWACADTGGPSQAPQSVPATFRVALGVDSLGRGIDSLRVRVLDSVRTVRANTRSDCVHLEVPIPVDINYLVFIPGGYGTVTMSWRADSGRANVWTTAAWGTTSLLFAQYMFVRAPCDTIAGISQ